jgi:hypothetical protein
MFWRSLIQIPFTRAAISNIARFEVHTAVLMNFSNFWYIATCSPCVNQLIEESWHLHIPGRKSAEQETSVQLVDTRSVHCLCSFARLYGTVWVNHRFLSQYSSFMIPQWVCHSASQSDLLTTSRFEIFTEVTMKNSVFWDVTPWGSCKNRICGGIYCFHLQGDTNRRTRNNFSSN